MVTLWMLVILISAMTNFDESKWWYSFTHAFFRCSRVVVFNKKYILFTRISRRHIPCSFDTTLYRIGEIKKYKFFVQSTVWFWPFMEIIIPFNFTSTQTAREKINVYQFVLNVFTHHCFSQITSTETRSSGVSGRPVVLGSRFIVFVISYDLRFNR